MARTVGLDYQAAATDPAASRQLLDELQRAVDETQEARQLDDEQPLSPVIEAPARAQRVAIFQLQGATANIESARRLADNTVKRFPDYAHAHFTRGVVLSIAGEPNGAIGEMTETVRLDPTFGKAFQLRADLYAERKECAPAMADLARAKELLPRLNPAVEQKVRRCR